MDEIKQGQPVRIFAVKKPEDGEYVNQAGTAIGYNESGTYMVKVGDKEVEATSVAATGPVAAPVKEPEAPKQEEVPAAPAPVEPKAEEVPTPEKPVEPVTAKPAVTK